MWKNNEQEEYEASAPAVKAHFHALRAEEAWKREDFAQAEREARLASEKFLEAANVLSDKRTIDALMLLAENYEYRSHEARAKMPEPVEAKAAISERDISASRMEIAERPLMNLGGVEAMKAEGFTQMSTGLEELDPKKNAGAENQLNQAAEEIEELWRRLIELGLSTAGNTDKNHLLMSSRHLSSSLGDSFCLLPTKARAPIGSNAVAIDGGSTLRAAVASRMRNQRVRLMEKQYGSRPAIDTRSPHAHINGSNGNLHQPKDSSATDLRQADWKSSSSRALDLHDPESLDGTVAHQKHEIVRLLNTVKTLSNENTTLLKKCDALTTVQEENRELQESMGKFKTHYNQKLVMIKRALEEWRRQQNASQQSAPAASTASEDTRSRQLEDQVQQQQLQIQQLTATLSKRDAQLAKYEQWYQTLKAGARAKRNQPDSGALEGSGLVPRDSFTNSNSLHELNRGTSTVDAMSSSQATPRPPAHPTRRAL